MDIVCMTVSTDYEDYLEISLQENHKFFSKWYIVTEIDDQKTQTLCSQYSTVECVFYQLRTAANVFRKGNALNTVQKIVYERHPSSLYLILDSDVCLPDDFREQIESIQINENVMYGADRLMYPTIKDYLLKNPDVNLLRWNPHSLIPDRTPSFHMVPHGYFQLYKAPQHFYPDSESAAECDVTFARKFPIRKNLKFVVSHLGTANVNWHGRTSAKES